MPRTVLEQTTEPELNFESEVTPVVRTRLSPASKRALDDAVTGYTVDNYNANAATRAQSRSKKDLHELMVELDVTTHTTSVRLPDGTMKIMEARIDEPDKEVISVERLRELVDDETFMKIVKATKTDVTKFAGTNVVIRSTMIEKDRMDLRVKEVRE